uniref:ARID domain-containing protein n=1 Tax=Megaselia scalaris TaxID=36166 RepID=T1GNP3_MEGSC
MNTSIEIVNCQQTDKNPARAYFMDELAEFMEKRGTPLERVPIMAKKRLDLYKLYNLVCSKGGIVQVTKCKQWSEICRELGFPKSFTSASFTVRSNYIKFLYPYECAKHNFSKPTDLDALFDVLKEKPVNRKKLSYSPKLPQNSQVFSPLEILSSQCGVSFSNDAQKNNESSESETTPNLPLFENILSKLQEYNRNQGNQDSGESQETSSVPFSIWNLSNRLNLFENNMQEKDSSQEFMGQINLKREREDDDEIPPSKKSAIESPISVIPVSKLQSNDFAYTVPTPPISEDLNESESSMRVLFSLQESTLVLRRMQRDN